MKDSQRKAMFAKLQYSRNFKVYDKPIKIPEKANIKTVGIYKQRSDNDGQYVAIGGNYKDGKYFRKDFRLPADAGLSRLIIGKKVVSRAV